MIKKDIFPKWEEIHTIIFDFDGVFTNNKVYINEVGEESIRCDRADGLAFDHLKKIKLAKDIILDRFDEPPTLVELSNEIDLSLRQLKQGFKETYGKPVFKYLFEYKMDKATRLLIEGKYNVNEVSMKLGYSTSSHFIHAFKKNFGITPLAYIKQNYES